MMLNDLLLDRVLILLNYCYYVLVPMAHVASD